MRCFPVLFSQLEGRLDAKFYDAPRIKWNPNFKLEKIGTHVDRIKREFPQVEVTEDSVITLSLTGEIKPKSIMSWRNVQENLFKAKFFEAKRGDFIFSKIDFRNGAFAVVDRYRIALTSEFPVYRPKSDSLNVNYLWMILRSERVMNFFDRISVGHSGRKRIDPKAFESFEIPLPAPKKQEEILSILDKGNIEKQRLKQEADDLLASIDAYILDRLGIVLSAPDQSKCYTAPISQMKKSRLDSHFHHPDFIKLEKASRSGHYTSTTLESIMVDMSGGATPRVEGNAYSTLSERGVPFLRVQNVAREGLRLDDVKYIKREIHDGELKRSQLKENDLVFTITGRIGSVSVIPKNFEGNINQHSVRIALKKNCEGTDISPNYIAAYLNTNFANKLMLRVSTGGTRPALDYISIKKLCVPLPDPKIQKAIADEVQSRMTKAATLKKQALDQLNQAKAEVEKILFEDACS